jgi:hypothetical protein
VTLHEGFEFWLAADAADDPNVKASLERANESIYPTQRLAAAPAAYWCQVPDKAHVRWVLPDDEDPALDALARLAAGDASRLGEGTRFAGMFRAHGPAGARLGPARRRPGGALGDAAGRRFAKRYRRGAGRRRRPDGGRAPLAPGPPRAPADLR